MNKINVPTFERNMHIKRAWHLFFAVIGIFEVFDYPSSQLQR